MVPITSDVGGTLAAGQAGLVQALIDALPQHITILDCQGRILQVNRAWLGFGHRNGLPDLSSISPGANYLRVCERAAAEGSEDAAAVREGLLLLLAGDSLSFEHEYRCDGLALRRWFNLLAVPLSVPGFDGVLVTHTLSTNDHNTLSALEARRHTAAAELLCMCAGCKRVRCTDSGWEDIEAYLAERWQERFTHGLCPECSERLYPETSLPA